MNPPAPPIADLASPEASRLLGEPVTAIRLLGRNAYCRIWRVETADGPVVVKRYRPDKIELARAEAEGVEVYARVAADDPRLIDGGVLARDDSAGLLALRFVAGERLSGLVYRGVFGRRGRDRAESFMGLLGELLRRLRETTVAPGRTVAPFLLDYLRYASRSLEALPVFGRLCFRGMTDEAERLIEDYRNAAPEPSFAHGDFVFRNMHVAGKRLGLVDFTNSHPDSHTLDDVCNLRFALGAMLLPRAYRRRLAAAFREGLGGATFPEPVRAFHHEYHRRRWLLLNLRTPNPLAWAGAARGALTFARPGRPAGDSR